MKKLLVAAILSVISSLSSLPLFAQAPPDVAQGMKLYDSIHGGAIDNVSLTNGNLFVHANLFSYSQRGGELAYPVVLQYNNKNFSIYQEPLMGATLLAMLLVALSAVARDISHLSLYTRLRNRWVLVPKAGGMRRSMMQN